MREVTLLAFILTGAVAQAQTAEELIATHIEVCGGRQRIEAVRSQRLTGTVFAYEEEARLTQHRRWPNLYRSEVEAWEEKFIQLFDGEKAWATDHEDMLLKLASEGQTRAIRTIANAKIFLLTYKENGHAVELVGREEWAGRPAHHLRVTLADGATREVYLDAETYLLRALVSHRDVWGDEAEIVTLFEDYKNVEDIPMAHLIETRKNGQTVYLVKYSKIENNLDFDQEIFQVSDVASPATIGKDAMELTSAH